MISSGKKAPLVNNKIASKYHASKNVKNNVSTIPEKELPRICLNMIVKDESHIIRECLATVAPYLDYWIISDTGSTDGTQDIIRKFFEEAKIPGELHEDPWKEFGPSRTVALRYCDGKVQYAWVIDADDFVVGKLPFPEEMTADSYELVYRLGGLNFSRHQVFRVACGWRYENVLHEYPVSEQAKPGVKITGDYYIQARTAGNRSKDPLKYYHDALKVERALVTDPGNTRYLFYGAQSYRDAGPDYRKQSVRLYQKRIKKGGGFLEEIYISHWEIARHFRAMKKSANEIRTACLEAFKILPSRSESLHELSEYCRQELHDYPGAYLYAKKAAQIPFPNDLKLFLVERIYRYDAQLNLAICAALLGKKEEAKKECETLIREAKERLIPEDRIRWIQNFITSLNQSYVPLHMQDQVETVTVFQENCESWINFLKKSTAKYLFFPGTDCIGNDITNQVPNTFERCNERCEQNPICLGFNTWGYLKYGLKDPSTFTSPDLFRPSDGLYVHRKKYLEQLLIQMSPEKNLLKDWIFYPQKDSKHGDLSCMNTLSLGELAEYVKSNPEAVGFNTRGWVKHYVKPEGKLESVPGFTLVDGLYVHPERFAEQQLLLEEIPEESPETI